MCKAHNLATRGAYCVSNYLPFAPLRIKKIPRHIRTKDRGTTLIHSKMPPLTHFWFFPDFYNLTITEKHSPVTGLPVAPYSCSDALFESYLPPLFLRQPFSQVPSSLPAFMMYSSLALHFSSLNMVLY